MQGSNEGSNEGSADPPISWKGLSWIYSSYFPSEYVHNLWIRLFHTDEVSVCDNSTNSTSDPEPEVVEVSSLKKDNVDAILDPANFSLDPLPVAKARVTKDSFMMMKNSPQLGAVNDPSDPLSLLDLWETG